MYSVLFYILWFLFVWTGYFRDCSLLHESKMKLDHDYTPRTTASLNFWIFYQLLSLSPHLHPPKEYRNKWSWNVFLMGQKECFLFKYKLVGRFVHCSLFRYCCHWCNSICFVCVGAVLCGQAGHPVVAEPQSGDCPLLQRPSWAFSPQPGGSGRRAVGELLLQDGDGRWQGRGTHSHIASIDTTVDNIDWLFCVVKAQEGEALLRFTSGSSANLVEAPEPSETSRDNIRSSDPRLVRPGPPAQARTKHHSGSNVSFSHDTEGGEDDQNQVELLDLTAHEASSRARMSNIKMIILDNAIIFFSIFCEKKKTIFHQI